MGGDGLTRVSVKPPVPPADIGPMAVGVSWDFSTAPQGFVTMTFQRGVTGLPETLRVPMVALGMCAAELAMRAVGVQPAFQGLTIAGPSASPRRG
jgi:hypothetical protein